MRCATRANRGACDISTGVSRSEGEWRGNPPDPLRRPVALDDGTTDLVIEMLERARVNVSRRRQRGGSAAAKLGATT